MHAKATVVLSQSVLEAAQSHLVSEIICTKRSLLLKHTQHYSFPPVDQRQAPARPVGAVRAEQTSGGEPPVALWVQHRQLHGALGTGWCWARRGRAHAALCESTFVQGSSRTGRYHKLKQQMLQQKLNLLYQVIILTD